MRFTLRSLLVLILLTAIGITWWEYAPVNLQGMSPHRREDYEKWQVIIEDMERVHAVGVWDMDYVQTDLKKYIEQFKPARNWTPRHQRHLVRLLPKSKIRTIDRDKLARYVRKVNSYPKLSGEQKRIMIKTFEDELARQGLLKEQTPP